MKIVKLNNQIKVGDLVLVKDYDEILATLDSNLRYGSTNFVERMKSMCGKTFICKEIKVYNENYLDDNKPCFTRYIIEYNGFKWHFRSPWVEKA